MFTNLISLDNSIPDPCKNLGLSAKFLAFVGLEGRYVGNDFERRGARILASYLERNQDSWELAEPGVSAPAFLKSLPVSPESWLMIVQV
jgi:hypothetical protein